MLYSALLLPAHAVPQRRRRAWGIRRTGRSEGVPGLRRSAQSALSDEQGEGFENKLAELFAQKLNEPTSYTYFPQVIGFIRNTLNALRCDVIMGTAVGDTMVQTTNPYYRTTYALVFKPDNGLDGIDSLADPRLKDKHIGIVAGTPPATVLTQNGLMALAKPYPLTVDTRVDVIAADDDRRHRRRARSMPGCCGGRWQAITRSMTTPHLTVVPLLKEGSPDGFPHRDGRAPNRPGLEAQAQQLIAENQPEIDKILAGVWRAVAGRAGQAQSAMNTATLGAAALRRSCYWARAGHRRAAEPSGYRMDDYRAPTPATLQGATVLTHRRSA